MSNKFETDVVIIGAGPVGLFAIFEAGMLKCRVHVVDTLDFVGGQCTALYPEKPIYDIPAHPSIDAADLIKNLEQQAEPFSPTYHLGQQVTGVQKQENGRFKVTTTKGTEIETKAIIIAAGCGAFGPNRPPLENLEEFEKTGSVAYLVRRKEDYRGKKIMIAGGGDSAVDWALSLADVAEKVYFIHRRAKFRAAPDSVEKLEKLASTGKVEMVIPYQLKALKGENGVLSHIEVEDLDNNVKSYEADHLLAFFGLSMELGPIANWGLNFTNNNITVDPSTSETSEKGIFAVGDICTYKGKLKLIACGFAEAAIAAHNIYPLVHDAPLHFEYSTTKGVPLDKAA
jgi:thioredoxin reductase (NADPH)